MRRKLGLIMLGLKPMEIVFVLMIVAIVAALLYGRNSMERMPADESGPGRLALYVLLILVSSIILWNLVRHGTH